MALITDKEMGSFISLFVRNYEVLNFSVAELDIFTLTSVGVSICDKYGLARVKSLLAFLGDASDEDKQKLIVDLFEYYEANYEDELCHNVFDSESRQKEKAQLRRHYDSCKTIIDRVTGVTSLNLSSGELLKEKFSSEYISKHIDMMIKMQTDNPTEAIGKAKELIECCCKTILEENNENIDKNWTVSQLARATMEFLGVHTDNIDPSTNEATTIKAILGNLSAIAGNIAELRNAYGSGHGKSAKYTGLTVRHAKLAVGTGITLVQYLWDTYEWKYPKRK